MGMVRFGRFIFLFGLDRTGEEAWLSAEPSRQVVGM